MPVAVKELLRSITGDDMHREMGILRTVTHRNVVRYYTHASDASYHYLVLERCECSLEQAVREHGDVHGGWPGPMVEGPGRMPTPESMVVAVGMVEGVAELHRVGVVHRDLKPSNILLARDEGDGGYGGGAVVAKVADLGLGKALGYGQSSFMSARAGGTQCWQAPEQIQTPPGAALVALSILHSLPRPSSSPPTSSWYLTSVCFCLSYQPFYMSGRLPVSVSPCLK